MALQERIASSQTQEFCTLMQSSLKEWSMEFNLLGYSNACGKANEMPMKPNRNFLNVWQSSFSKSR